MLKILFLGAIIAGAYFLLKAIWDYEIKIAQSEKIN